MAGKKGRSGRKPLVFEVRKHEIINKAWNKVNYKLGMKDSHAYSIAGNMVVKDMTGKEEIKSDITVLDTYSNMLEGIKSKRAELIHSN